jgi:Domain of unknown function (DUF4157)
VPTSVRGVLQSAGEPLTPDVRTTLHSRFGSDFCRVRVHADSGAAESASAVQAAAYTVGRHIVFAPGQYRPDTEQGRRLLTHEVAHVVQQFGDDDTNTSVSWVSSPNDPAELEAEAVAGGLTEGPSIRQARRGLLRQQPPSGPSAVSLREARAVGGELGMGFAYRAEQGWAFLSGPGGSAGHRWNEPGFDGVAFRVQGQFEIHILDNKSLARAGNISSASALTTNLLKNLDGLITTAGDPRFNTTPRIQQVRSALAGARAAIAANQPLPPHVELRVTSFGGRSTGITAGLAARGVRFTGTAGPGPVGGAAPPAPTGGPAGPAAAGSAGPGPTGGSAAGPTGTTGQPAGGSPKAGGAAATHVAAPQQITPAPRPTLSSGATGAATAEARAIAAEVGKTLRTDLRLLRAARVLNAAVGVVNIIGALQMLDQFTGMARSALAGQGFILTGQIAQARQLEREAVALDQDYRPFSDSVQEQGWHFLRVSADGANAGAAASGVSQLHSAIRRGQVDLPARIERVASALREVRAKEEAAQRILDDPAATGALIFASFGSSAQVVEVFAVHEDLVRIRGSLQTTLNALRSVDGLMRSDLEFLDSWFDVLFESCRRAGICSTRRLDLPFGGSTTLRSLPGEEP